MSFLRPKTQPSAFATQAARGGLLLAGVDEDLAMLCAAAAAEVGVGVARAAHGPSACRALDEHGPSVVVVGSALWSDERELLKQEAHRRGVAVFEPERRLDPASLALVLVRLIAEAEGPVWMVRAS